MSENDESGAARDGGAKSLEVARIHFYVETSMTVVTDPGNVAVIVLPPPRRLTQAASGFDEPVTEIPVAEIRPSLVEALDELVSDAAGDDFRVVQVAVQPAGSIEIVAVVVGTYLAITQVVDVVENLEKAARLGQRLVRAVLRARGMPEAVVHARLVPSSALGTAISPAIAESAGNRVARTPIGGRLSETTSLLLLLSLNLVVGVAILVAVLTL